MIKPPGLECAERPEEQKPYLQVLLWPPGVAGGEVPLAGPDESWKGTLTQQPCPVPLERAEGHGGRKASCSDRIDSPGDPRQPVPASCAVLARQREAGVGERPDVGGLASQPPLPTFGQVLIIS